MSPSAPISTLHHVAGTSAPSHRARVLEQILERYNDFVDPMQSRAQPGEGAGLMLMPGTWTPSVRELERLIRVMRDHDPRAPKDITWEADNHCWRANVHGLWWHLNYWYIAVERATWTPPLRTVKSKKRQLRRQPVDQQGVALPQVRVIRRADARYQVAAQGVVWLSENWGLSHEPMLPSELRDAA